MMIVELGNGFLSAQREPGDPPLRGGSWGSAEASFYRRIRDRLRALGFDVIRQNPGKDGHLTGAPYYIRDRQWAYCYHDPRYALRCPAEDYNAGERVRLERFELQEG